jgi:hypothetical protein
MLLFLIFLFFNFSLDAGNNEETGGIWARFDVTLGFMGICKLELHSKAFSSSFTSSPPPHQNPILHILHVQPKIMLQLKMHFLFLYARFFSDFKNSKKHIISILTTSLFCIIAFLL